MKVEVLNSVLKGQKLHITIREGLEEQVIQTRLTWKSREEEVLMKVEDMSSVSKVESDGKSK
jgi:hypothetical protein